jgi:AAA+ ATPase superfamily predicted ATPase
MPVIGRKEESLELRRYYESGRPELVTVTGRRRVGKTFLVRETFGADFAFYFTGTARAANAEQLANFDKALSAYGAGPSAAAKNWSDAFGKLQDLLKSGRKGVRKVVFLDEMPWIDAPGSGFLTAFDYFWNSYASADPDILCILCGSAASWMAKKLFKNKGGLHNRVTGRIFLKPFSLRECEAFFADRGIVLNRYQILESYMVFGGIPYYMDMFDGRLGFSQNVDRLCFAAGAPLRDEYAELYHSLFGSPERHLAVVEALAGKAGGLTRDELLTKTGFSSNGHFSAALDDLEQCGFIERCSDFTKPKKDAVYLLKDPFTLFYLRYVKGNDPKDDYFWTNFTEDGGHRAWSGYAFEQVCMAHVPQIKRALGISGISTRVVAWRGGGAQIDLVIDRRDGVVNLCEMKYTKHPFTIDKRTMETLERRKQVFLAETKTPKAVHLTMVTTYGLERKGYASLAQSEVIMDDLFA